MFNLKSTISAALISAAMLLPVQANAETLKLAVLKIGTVNWELDTIVHFGLDKAAGFDLEVQGMAGNPATRVAFQAGEVDAMVADWLWVARQRADGKDFVFIPYSTAVGGMLVKGDSPIHSLADMKGKKVGIAGGPVDKSWLILQAYAKQQTGQDLAGETEQVFGSPPLIFKSGLSGEVQGVINFWHFMAKMKAKGFREIVTVAEASAALGLDPKTPLLGYVVTGKLVRENPELVKGLVQASRAAKEILANDDAAWERLRPLMRATDDAAFEALKSGFRAGIPSSDPVNLDAAKAMFAVMYELGGEKLMGSAKTLPDGVFYTSD